MIIDPEKGLQLENIPDAVTASRAVEAVLGRDDAFVEGLEIILSKTIDTDGVVPPHRFLEGGDELVTSALSTFAENVTLEGWLQAQAKHMLESVGIFEVLELQ